MGRSEKRLHSLGEKSELELKVSLICINKKNILKHRQYPRFMKIKLNMLSHHKNKLH